MEPIAYFAGLTLISLAVPLFVERFGREYLIGLLPAFLLTANVLAESFISIGPWLTSLAVPLYAGTFLITDIITERYGKEDAKRAVWLGIIGQLLFVGVLTIILTAPILPEKKEAFEVTLGFMRRLIVASAIAYLVSQFLDVYLFEQLRKATGGRHKWIRNNGSTIASQFVDTAIFLAIAFYGRPPFTTFGPWFGFVVTTWAFKVVVALADTPFFYLATGRDRQSRE